MKTMRIGRFIIAILFLLGSASINLRAEAQTNNNSVITTSNYQIQTDEEDPVEIDPTEDPFSADWILTILGL
ncbi:hypothetical protein [Carboxylicivirga sp. M1479]|uniref:hypothetical protein n=1 Tax=Carboxylicivirga sp. M1479 TaxID=2594476 RepID=UPI001178BA02|nr:hypothetical protein [Carboxylicivirga sp. M1479]TRX66408.1 hypothetical protein FNN09_13665 [Carboxylicivirga sp. M1479]